MKKILLAVLIVLLAVGLTFFIRMNQNTYSDSVKGSLEVKDSKTILNNNTQVQNFSDDQTESSDGKITASVLVEHDTLEDCWVAYDGKVYDITSFLPKHQGSAAAIEPYCGTSSEFEKAFTKKHGTSKLGMLMRVGVLMGDFDVVGVSN